MSLVVGVVLAFLIVAPPASASRPTSADGLSFTRVKGPARTVVSDGEGQWVATFTDASRTVTLAGPPRTLSEPGVEAVVPSTTYVRVLPAPFAGQVDRAWLAAARSDPSPDLLAMALEYVAGAVEARDAAGVLASGDASYGPLLSDGSREEGSDWNDYQQLTASYGSVVDPPEERQAGAIDCSGYMRMIWGVRSGLPMTLDADGVGLPRRAVQMATSAPGVVPIANRGRQVTDLTRVAPGDLVFFDASADDGTDIDHVGMYLGRDLAGRPRFVSSRKSIDGPTMGDHRGMSVLDGTGLYAKAFRSTRRL